MKEIFSRSVTVPVSVEELFAWHERPGAFRRLSPPWDTTTIISQDVGITHGSRVTMQVNVGLVPTTWEVEHRDYIKNVQFKDVALSSPFASYIHTHTFEAVTANSSTLTDSVEYELPLGVAGNVAGGWFARDTFERVFAYRHELMMGDLLRHATYRNMPRMRIAITGASGLIGSQLSAFLTTGGHSVVRIGRKATGSSVSDIIWEPRIGKLDAASLEGVDAVIHLAGAPIAERWTESHKREIHDSRVEGTSLLSHVLSQLSRKPKVLLSGSAIGYYGSRGDEILEERSKPGDDWLSRTAVAWEGATAPAERAGVRVVHLRTGIVQGAAGGMLAKVAPIFRLGGGGKIGDGSQWISPIALDDEIGAIYHCLMNSGISGAVNLVAPNPVTNSEYTAVLASVLNRPAFARVPAFALQIAMGEMATNTVLASQRVLPSVLQRTGFSFRYPLLNEMLRFELGQ